MQNSLMVRVEGADLVVRFADTAVAPPVNAPGAVVISKLSGKFSSSTSGRIVANGAHREFVCPLPWQIFDGQVHQLGLASQLWQGSLEVTVAPKGHKPVALQSDADSIAPDPASGRGRLEYCDGEMLRGWAYKPKEWRDRAKVIILVDNAVYATVTADERRHDLFRKRIGDGRHGFSKAMPPELLDGKRHVITCILADTGLLLEKGIHEADLGVFREEVIKEISWRVERLESLFD